MSFSVCGSYVALCNNERVIIYDIDDDTERTEILPELKSNDGRTDVRHNNADIETYHMITSVIFSENGEYFAVCTNRKQLCLYETRDARLLSNRTLARAASRVRFSPNNDIVVADKAGDVYLFSTDSPTRDGVPILGHLSMLLDVLIARDLRHIVTTDRDEKIRVSMFPNCYSIASYCLGHVKFVTNISELPHERSVLVSCGGDGLLKLWDYKRGIELKSVDFSDKIPEDDVEKFNRNLRDYNFDESVDILPVKHLRLSRLGRTESLFVISFYSSKVLLVYSIVGDETQSDTVNYLESMTVEREPVECFLHERDLWILTDAGLQAFKFQDNRFVKHDALDRVTKRLNESWETLRNVTVKQNLFPILYKRNYDNIQEYFQRKKIRLASSTE